jgi:hypothetical protein
MPLVEGAQTIRVRKGDRRNLRHGIWADHLHSHPYRRRCPPQRFRSA